VKRPGELINCLEQRARILEALHLDAMADVVGTPAKHHFAQIDEAHTGQPT